MNIHDILIDAIEASRPLVEKIARRDRDLAKQLRNAASSAALNAEEGEWGRKGHKLERLSTAMNSAREARRALLVAAAWGYLESEEAARAEDRFDHAAASLWKMMKR